MAPRGWAYWLLADCPQLRIGCYDEAHRSLECLVRWLHTHGNSICTVSKLHKMFRIQTCNQVFWLLVPFDIVQNTHFMAMYSTSVVQCKLHLFHQGAVGACLSCIATSAVMLTVQQGSCFVAWLVLLRTCAQSCLCNLRSIQTSMTQELQQNLSCSGLACSAGSQHGTAWPTKWMAWFGSRLLCEHVSACDAHSTWCATCVVVPRQLTKGTNPATPAYITSHSINVLLAAQIVSRYTWLWPLPPIGSAQGILCFWNCVCVLSQHVKPATNLHLVLWNTSFYHEFLITIDFYCRLSIAIINYRLQLLCNYL